MSLELNPEVEQLIRDHAAAEGVSINELLTRTFASEKLDKRPVQDPRERVRTLLAELQAQDNTPRLPPIPTREGETPTEALFRKWQEEDTGMTEEEVKADEHFWEEFQQSIDSERRQAGMRTLFCWTNIRP